jgi:hypothetical protein
MDHIKNEGVCVVALKKNPDFTTEEGQILTHNSSNLNYPKIKFTEKRIINQQANEIIF